MKRIKLLASLFIMLAVGMFSSIVCHADMVDELCELCDYDTRWSIDVELDNTYKNTWLYGLSDYGKISITYIDFNGAMKLSGGSIRKCFVFQGNGEYAFEANGFGGTGNSPYANMTAGAFAIIKENDVWSTIDIDDERNPLYNLIDKDNYYGLRATRYYGLNNDDTQECIIIDNFYTDGRGITVTPIIIDNDTLLQIDEIKTLGLEMQERNKIKANSIPANYIIANPVIRDNAQLLGITRADMVEEEVELMQSEVEYDEDEIRNSVESDALKSISHDGTVAYVNGKKYYLMVKNGRLGYIYYISKPIGELYFELDVQPDEMPDISSNGKIEVAVELYKQHRLSAEYPEEGLKSEKKVYGIATITGDKGSFYGYLAFKSMRQPAWYVSGYMYSLYQYDGNILCWEEENRSMREAKNGQIYDNPQLFYKYDTDTRELTDVGLAFGENDNLKFYSIPIENVKIDEAAEVEAIKCVWKYYGIAKPVVEKARAERGAVDSVKLEPAASPEPTATPEPAKTQEPTEEAEKDEISIIINGEELELDVKPQISGDRVLVPLRAIFEKLGAAVDWNGETGAVTISKDDTKIEFRIDNTEVKVNDGEKQMDVPAQIIDERALVPMRFLAVELGYDVDWDAKNQDVLINVK